MAGEVPHENFLPRIFKEHLPTRDGKAVGTIRPFAKPTPVLMKFAHSFGPICFALPDGLSQVIVLSNGKRYPEKGVTEEA